MSYCLPLLKGRPELSTFSTYEITSHKWEEGGRKSVEILIVLSDAIFLSLKKCRLSRKEVRKGVKKL